MKDDTPRTQTPQPAEAAPAPAPAPAPEPAPAPTPEPGHRLPYRVSTWHDLANYECEVAPCQWSSIEGLDAFIDHWLTRHHGVPATPTPRRAVPPLYDRFGNVISPPQEA